MQRAKPETGLGFSIGAITVGYVLFLWSLAMDDLLTVDPGPRYALGFLPACALLYAAYVIYRWPFPGSVVIARCYRLASLVCWAISLLTAILLQCRYSEAITWPYVYITGMFCVVCWLMAGMTLLQWYYKK